MTNKIIYKIKHESTSLLGWKFEHKDNNSEIKCILGSSNFLPSTLTFNSCLIYQIILFFVFGIYNYIMALYLLKFPLRIISLTYFHDFSFYSAVSYIEYVCI